VIGVFLWWRSRPPSGHALPAERVIGAIRVGFRHVRNNYHLRCTLRRAAAFFMFASAYWALLPLVARGQIGGGPELYGILLGAIGLGAVGGAVVLARLKGKVGANRMVTAGQIGTAIALALFGAAREPVVAVAASLMAGMCWIAVLANLNVSAQTALPDWVRGRGLAMYVTVFFGTMTVTSAAWGWLAGIAGLPATHFVAAAGALLVLPLTARWKLQTAAGIDLSPSMHWPAPVVSEALENDSGPVMVTVEYRVEPPDRDAFLRAIEKVAAERRRDGAYAWEMFQDTADPTRFVETFFFESWLEHLRQHERVTNADRMLEDHVRKYSQAAPVVTHFVAARPNGDEVSR
jgi:MFS family permease